MDSLEANIMDKSMRSVFVGNIPYEATEEKLKDIFGEVGQVLSFKLVFDRETGKPKGYGFCEYRDQETALSAMRNLNGYEIGGRNLRVDNACTEKSRMEMQNLLNQPPVENPYGEPVQSDKAPEAISKAVASLPPEQMFELMKQMKFCIQNNPSEARQMLLQNPQLAYALLQAQVVMRIIDPHIASGILHPTTPTPAPLMPSDPIAGPVPINNAFLNRPEPPIRSEFQPVPPPVIHPNNQTPVFTGQDIDLRSLDPRGQLPMDTRPPVQMDIRQPPPVVIDPRAQTNIDIRAQTIDPRSQVPDPRIVRLGDQDMRSIPSNIPNLPNPLPPPVAESFNRDPRDRMAPQFPIDPRSRPQDIGPARIDPRQKNIVPPPSQPQPVRPPVQPVAPPVQQVPRASALNSAIVTGQSAGASDQEKAALIMQVLQLSDEQIAMLPPEQRNSILVLKEQIAKTTHRT